MIRQRVAVLWMAVIAILTVLGAVLSCEGLSSGPRPEDMSSRLHGPRPAGGQLGTLSVPVPSCGSPPCASTSWTSSTLVGIESASLSGLPSGGTFTLWGSTAGVESLATLGTYVAQGHVACSGGACAVTWSTAPQSWAAWPFYATVNASSTGALAWLLNGPTGSTSAGDGGSFPVPLPVIVEGGVVTCDQGAPPWSIDGTVTCDQGAAPWSVTVEGALVLEGGTVTCDQGAAPWAVAGIDGGALASQGTQSAQLAEELSIALNTGATVSTLESVVGTPGAAAPLSLLQVGGETDAGISTPLLLVGGALLTTPQGCSAISGTALPIAGATIQASTLCGGIAWNSLGATDVLMVFDGTAPVDGGAPVCSNTTGTGTWANLNGCVPSSGIRLASGNLTVVFSVTGPGYSPVASSAGPYTILYR